MPATPGFILVADLLKDIGQVVRNCPGTAQQRAYVRAVRDWCRQTHWYGENVPFTATIGTAIYDVTKLGQVEVLALEAGQIQPLPAGTGVVPVSLGIGDPRNFVPDQTNGQPIRMGYLPEGAVMLDPPPDKAYPITLRLVCQPTIEATEIPGALVVKWQTAFEAGALAYLMALKGEPWADPAEQLRYARIFQSRVNDGKADKQRGYVVGSVRATPRPFITRGFGWRSP